MTGIAEDNDFRFLADYIINNLSSSSKRAPDDISQENEAGFYDTADDEEESVSEQEADYNNEAQESQGQTQDDSGMDQFWNDYFFSEDNLPAQSQSAPSYSLKDFHSSGSNKGFQTFGSYQEGKNALINQLQLYQTGRTRNKVGPNSTLLQAMSVYAPSSDNNDPSGYAKFIAKKLGVSVDTPISQIDTRAWADAIEKMEGNKTGNNPGNLRTYQAGGIPVAEDAQQQYIGLNDNSFDELILPLEGSNIIRGLDNGKPVFIRDQTGKTKILKGANHTAKMYGKIYEQRL